MKNLLSTAEAAAELGVSTARIRALIDAGRLKAERLGVRSWVIAMKDLEAVRVRIPGRPKSRQPETTGI